MVDIISFVISISATAGMQDLTAAEVAAEMAAWERYNHHIAIISYAVTGISALLGGGAIASLGVGLFHAFKQAQSMATSLAMFGAGKAIGGVKAAQAAKAAAAEKAGKEAASAAKESKIEAASAAKAEQDEDRTFMGNIRGAGVNPQVVAGMFKPDNKAIFKENGYYGQKIDRTTGDVHRLDPKSFSGLSDMDHVGVNMGSPHMNSSLFGELADKVKDRRNFFETDTNGITSMREEKGGEFFITGKNGITSKFEREGNYFYETTHGHENRITGGATAQDLFKRFS